MFENSCLLFAFPPCTHVAVSGARWFKDKGLGALIESLELLDAAVRLAEWTRAPYMIENPVSTVSSYWRKPDFTFDPWEYGGYLQPADNAYTKKTCLWVGDGFRMPKLKPVQSIEGSRMHLMGPFADRGVRRAETPNGFANAVFATNSTGWQGERVHCIFCPGM